MKIVLISALLAASISLSHAEESQNPLAQAVNTACAQEGTTAGCGTEKVGTGLIKCIGAYKKGHKDFKASEGCREAMKKLRVARNAKKAQKAKLDAKAPN